MDTENMNTGKTPESAGKTIDDLMAELNASLMAEELHPTFGYGHSLCPRCRIMVHPFENRMTNEGRILSSFRRKVVNVSGSQCAVFDPVCPQCGDVLPAVILGGNGHDTRH